MKRCTRCAVKKFFSSFSPRGDRPGVRSWCKACVAEDSRLRYQACPWPKRRKMREYSTGHPKEMVDGVREWRSRHHGRFLAMARRYRVLNRDRLNAYQRERWAKLPVEVRRWYNRRKV